ncbi:Pc21g06750 [Penicillium rubens Wisconsin 54-1255]|uniref:Pc21g06750 protein n=1 Tax=Penicillium rubens (strain ATCC 28089 / DSM 1075 / NRRL 1951 / Wisconsin 54-1255) TaxID=500485 RepID=B6HJP3_PENRW|nr:Pc21g06750 [Penicillium rubens Wisconsin 54-1255]
MEDVIELEGFPPSIHRYPYHGRDDFLAIMDYERSLPYSNKHEIFLVTDINKERFECDFRYADETMFSRSWKEYLVHLNILLMKMPSAPHERAIQSLQRLITIATLRQGLVYDIRSEGSKYQKLQSRVKQPDNQIYPARFQSRGYPSIVFEVAKSETGRQLQRDTEKWLFECQNEVLSVITIYIGKRNRTMTLRRSTVENGSLAMKQEVDITVEPGILRSQGAPVISNAPFTIPFSHLLLREPNFWTWPRERDLQLTKADLTILAEDTWKLHLGSSSRKSTLKQPSEAVPWLIANITTLLAILGTLLLAPQAKPFPWLVVLLAIQLAIFITFLFKL